MTYWELYLIAVHLFAFVGLALIGSIALHVAMHWNPRRLHRRDETDGTELAKTTVYNGPSYGLRLVK